MRDELLAALAAECCLRLCAACHRATHRHYAPPGGRARCFGPSAEPPESWLPTAAQAAYDATREGGA
jgi:hypothetical protein